jgi:aldose 1-epimerase
MSEMEPPTGAQHQLARGDQRAVVTEVGATLRHWSAGGRDRLDGFGEDDWSRFFEGNVLLPWPNRIFGARYAFAGTEHQLAITEPEAGNALHGLVAVVNWRAVDAAAERVTLAYTLHPQRGYPFTLELTVTHELTDAGLELELRARNVGAADAPFGAGFHPYLRLGDDGIEDLELDLPAAGAPSGRLDGVELDGCFAHPERDADGIARARLTAPDGERTTVWMDEQFDYVQVYTADAVEDPARVRRSVAVEPMTCPPDAFNTGEGLIVLAPGEAFAGRCGLSRS